MQASDNNILLAGAAENELQRIRADRDNGIANQWIFGHAAPELAAVRFLSDLAHKLEASGAGIALLADNLGHLNRDFGYKTDQQRIFAGDSEKFADSCTVAFACRIVSAQDTETRFGTPHREHAADMLLVPRC